MESFNHVFFTKKTYFFTFLITSIVSPASKLKSPGSSETYWKSATQRSTSADETSDSPILDSPFSAAVEVKDDAADSSALYQKNQIVIS